jgi:coenzyme PQQ precursor peptide PqqA
MSHGTWARPEFHEINLSAEIGMYVEIAGGSEDHPGDPSEPERSDPADHSTAAT